MRPPGLVAGVRRAVGWVALVALVELVTHTLVYALAPTPAARLAHLEGALGGPHPLVVAAVALGGAILGSTALLYLAALGVRERWAFSDPVARGLAPRLRWTRALRDAGLLWLAGLAVFVAVESYLHYRAGLGFHALQCLLGPVHVNALPVCAAVSLLVAALRTATEHLLRWMQRVVTRLKAGRPRHWRGPTVAPPISFTPARGDMLAALRPRPPPLLVA